MNSIENATANETDPTLSPELQLTGLIKELGAANKEIVLFSLASTDGFNIKTVSVKGLDVESDKLAAMSSSMFALGNSSSEQLMKCESTIITIESENGNYFLVKAEFKGKPCVISMVAKSSMQLAQARFHLKKITQAIAEIS